MVHNLMIKKYLVITVCCLISLFFVGCSRNGVKYPSMAERIKFIKTHGLYRLPKFDIPIIVNSRVVAWLEYYQGRGKRSFRKYLERSGKYLPMMRQILKDKGVPQDLIYMVFIESGFNVNARSHANAVGAWQFIRSTGKNYNLKIDGWIDERRDPVKATVAAATFLKKLYGDFNNWHLAMAGYNAGEGKVGRAIKKTGTRDYWKIIKHKKALRPETRDYVPKILAAAIIAKMPKEFGFEDIDYELPFEYDQVNLRSAADFRVIAKCAGTSEKEIRGLNPHLIQRMVPPGGSYVRLPPGKKGVFLTRLAKIPRDERVTIVYHRVRSRETLSNIARKHRVKIKDIVAANNLKSKHKIYPGQKLLIPKRGYHKTKSRRNKFHDTPTSNSHLVYHRIKGGETLSQIAEKYNVGLSKLKKWNRLGSKSRIMAGKELKIYTAAPKTNVASGYHTVKRGETLSHISSKYNVQTKQLMAWNNLKSPKHLKAGKKIRVTKAVKKNSRIVAKSKIKTTISTKHKLKSGESLYLVARKYGITTKDLVAWNNIQDPKKVRAGTILKIHATNKKVATKSSPIKSKKTNNEIYTTTHKLKSGESLYRIALAYGISVNDLMAWNNIDNPRIVRAGKVLKIKSTSRINPKLKSNNNEIINYKIRPGDTLWEIARKNGVTVAQLKKWNRLSNSKVKPGDKLTIYR